MTQVQRVADYMVVDLITLSPDMEINHAMSILLDHSISGAPVVDKTGNLAGVLSKKDCLKAALEASYYREWGETVAHYMSTDVETLDAGVDIVTAAKTFLNSVYRRFPVMQEGQLIGQISRADVLRAMKDNWA